MAQLVLALAPGSVPQVSEPWVLPEDLDYARAEQHVDLMSVCRVASHILFMLSGRRYGVRTETLRPTAGQNSCGWGALARLPYAGVDCLWQYRANEGAPEYLTLKSPVQSIQAVKVDGVVLGSSDYQLYDNRTLVRLGGLRWPIHQRLDLPDTEVGSFSLTYQWGAAVPEGARVAAKVFATELAKYLNRDGSALPDRTVSITRAGVTQTLLDPSEFVKQARTGLYLCDIWLGSVNPSGLKRRPSIVSPETLLPARPT